MPDSLPAWTAFVPVRAGSKGLPDKNIRPLAGKPLFRHAVDHALEAGAAAVWISTDIPALLDIDHGPRVRVIERPAELAADTSPMAPVLVQALQATGVHGTAVLLQATSPLRQAADVRAALAVHAAGGVDLVMSVTEADRGVLKWGRVEGTRFVPLADPAFCFFNRQALPPVVRPNGAVYVFDADWFVHNGGFVTERIGVVEMPAARSLDIDRLADFERCEAALAALSPEPKDRS